MTEANRIRRNVEAQERVVGALWDFAHKQATRPHYSRRERDGTTVNIEAVGETLAEIMEAFGYAVTPIE